MGFKTEPCTTGMEIDYIRQVVVLIKGSAALKMKGIVLLNVQNRIYRYIVVSSNAVMGIELFSTTV